MNDNYLELYGAIWTKAIEDDIAKVVKELTVHGFNSAYELFTLNYLEKNAEMIVSFMNNEIAMNCIRVIEELQEVEIIDISIYKTANKSYTIIIDEKLYIIKGNYIAKNDERFKKFKAELLEYCKIKARDIEQRLRKLVYEESQEWPYNQRYKTKDKEYNEILTQLKDEVAEYAREKMAKRWYRL